MQLNKAEKLAVRISNEMKEYFMDKMDNIVIDRVMDEPHIEFSISFEAYNYFIIVLNYDRGSFGCCISAGEFGIGLESSQQWYDKANMEVFYKEIEEQLELRIPDKFLIAKGWK